MTESDTTPTTSKTHYSIAEAARLKGVHPNTVRKYVRQGRIKAEMVRGPFGTEYAIPEAELDSLGVPVVDTAQGSGVSLTPHPDTLTLAFQAALAELATSHQRTVAAKDETIALLSARVQTLEEEVRLLAAPARGSAISADPTDQPGVETPQPTPEPASADVRASQAPQGRSWWAWPWRWAW